MDLEIVLNELSLRTPAPDIQTARQWMSDLISTVRTATAQGVKKVIRTQSDFQGTVLAPDYPLRRWRNDPEVDRETRLFFKTLITKAPFLTDVVDPEIENRVNLSDFKHQGEQASGLGHALLLNALALSLRSKEQWYLSRLELEVTRLDENENFIDELVEIIHASCRDHVLEHADWIKNTIRTKVNDGLDLWNRKDELLPSLEFCESVAKQLQSIRTGNLELQPVVKALFELEVYCKNRKTGAFSLEGYLIEASRESQPTLNKYGKQRTFRCLDGKERLFDWHVKLKLCNWRIHFFPDVGQGKIIIGYVGRHLPTVSDPT
jgi:hypothetical protein